MFRFICCRMIISFFSQDFDCNGKFRLVRGESIFVFFEDRFMRGENEIINW